MRPSASAFSAAASWPCSTTALPVRLIETVQQVEVDAVGLQALELRAEDAIEVAGLLDVPDGHLGGHLDLLAVAVLERLREPGLAGLLVIHPGGVDVVHTAVDGAAQHRRGLRIVDPLEVGLAVGAGEDGQAHGTEAERRGPEVELAEGAVLHGRMLPPPAHQREPPAAGGAAPARGAAPAGSRYTRAAMTVTQHPEIIIQARRGGTVESVHRAVAALAGPDGEIVERWGDPGMVTFWRSSAKPFQAQAWLVDGTVEHFGWGAEQLAIMSASHDGLDFQAGLVRGMLADLGLCRGRSALRRQLKARHNCSGNHTGFLAASVHHGWDVATYQQPGHPAQEAALQMFAACVGLDPRQVPTAVDGCGIVCYATPVTAAAATFALMPDLLPEISAAMRAHPTLVEGPGRIDTSSWRPSPAPPASAAPRASAACRCPTGAASPSRSSTAPSGRRTRDRRGPRAVLGAEAIAERCGEGPAAASRTTPATRSASSSASPRPEAGELLVTPTGLRRPLRVCEGAGRSRAPRPHRAPPLGRAERPSDPSAFFVLLPEKRDEPPHADDHEHDGHDAHDQVRVQALRRGRGLGHLRADLVVVAHIVADVGDRAGGLSGCASSRPISTCSTPREAWGM